ncbi:MAG: hypothetical protein WHS83_09615 [Chloroflexus sp.]|uniref:hypothetical protein n=1 Tax=Chloroflexus sp. TaxID=1904827 RepID=UPI0030AC8275
MDNNTLIYFLQDFVVLLLEQAMESKQRREACLAANPTRERNTDACSYERGHVMAYYEVLSLFVHQMIAFDIPADQLGIPTIDPDELLR